MMFSTTANLVLLAQISWPFNPELIRERYGQTALFRFDLGVGDVQKQRCRQDAAAWNGSKQQQAMEQALSEGEFFIAGQQLAIWLKQC